MNKKAAIGIGALVVVILAVGAWLVWPRGTTEVTEDKALKDFRNRSETTDTTVSDAGQSGSDATTATEPAGDSTGVPEAGVYTYTGSGEEVIKLGPLPEERHTIPATVTAVVVDNRDGCFDYTLNLFEQHVEDTTYCVTDAGLTISTYAKKQQIAALSTTVTITCDPGVVRSDNSASLESECTLELAGGPVPVKASFPAKAVIGDPEQRTVGGESVDVVPVTITYDITGSVSGTWVETLWLNDANLPVSVERSFNLSGGPARFDEQFKLDLSSLTPTT